MLIQVNLKLSHEAHTEERGPFLRRRPWALSRVSENGASVVPTRTEPRAAFTGLNKSPLSTSAAT